VLTSLLSASLLVSGLALVALLYVLVKARGDRLRSHGLVERLSNAVHQTADAVFITDRSGIIEYVNPAFERTTGYTSDEAIGRTPRILKSGEQHADYYERLWRTVLDGRPFHGTLVNRKRDGALFHAEQTVTPMTNGIGRISHFVSVLRDMTDRRLIEERDVEMRLAASIQRNLLPHDSPQFQGWELAGAVLPALATCGDYFDFIQVGDDTMCLVVADACGHGVGPALIAVQTRAYLRSLLQTGIELDQVLGKLNQILTSDLDDGLFVTMSLVSLEAATGNLGWANAGHPSAYVFDAAGHVKAELRSSGLPLGLLAGRQYTAAGHRLSTARGDIVLMITDGFLEAENAAGVAFGAVRLRETILDSVQLPAAAIVRRLLDAVRDFAGNHPQQDDLTAVVCRRTASSPLSATKG
jgi:sigma-B regulation protein RsbU (phosphoserine phosphatase)